MKVLVIGRTGQVARELQRRAPAGVEITAWGRDVIDLSDAAGVAHLVHGVEADAIINAAAWTAVDAAEAEEPAAMAVNGAAPTSMARAAAARRIPFLHVSTDYVFDGQGATPFTEDDPTVPLSAYGRTKLAGERGVRAAGGPHVILRTSWVVAGHGKNFVGTMLRLGAARDSLRVVADQHGAPTPAASIADALLLLAARLAAGAEGGTYHFAGTPDTTWAGFAGAIMQAAGLPCRIDPITTADYPTPAQRPANSRLDCARIARDFGIARPDWHAALPGIISELQS
jgi:dTDP-4-dehydrorhamnose reductase